MRKKTTDGSKRRFTFPQVMLIYGIAWLAVILIGLAVFWDYMAEYEKTRPLSVLDAYIDSLDEDTVYESSGELIGKVDHNLQSEQVCRRIFGEVVSERITYAKKTAECTQTRLVYVLRSGSQVIGTVTMDASGTGRHGFTGWEITESRLDLSFLLGERLSITVPENYPVYADGVLLDDRYIVKNDIQFEILEDFYKMYDMPVLVTYEAGPILGDTALTVTDPDGNPVEINENTDYDVFLDNCTPEEVKSLEAFGEDFLDHYVAFTGSAFKSSERSYEALMDYVVEGSDLATRMEMALEGLEWAQSRGDELVNVTFNHLINVGNDRYLCDVTYQVDTTGREGVVRTTNNARFVVVDTGEGLLVETLLTY